MMLRCDKCEKDSDLHLETGQRYCLSCGEDLTFACIECQRLHPKGAKYCAKTGRDLELVRLEKEREEIVRKIHSRYWDGMNRAGKVPLEFICFSSFISVMFIVAGGFLSGKSWPVIGMSVSVVLAASSLIYLRANKRRKAENVRFFTEELGVIPPKKEIMLSSDFIAYIASNPIPANLLLRASQEPKSQQDEELLRPHGSVGN
jgi:hypothetical protein